MKSTKGAIVDTLAINMRGTTPAVLIDAEIERMAVAILEWLDWRKRMLELKEQRKHARPRKRKIAA